MTDRVSIRKILVPTDGSETSLRAARYASEIARCAGAEIVVLNAAEVSGVTQFVTYAVEASENLPAKLRHTGEDIVTETRKVVMEAGMTAHAKIIEGPAADVIIREAQDGDYDLIAMGSVGAGAGFVRRVFLGLGSVAQRVVANAPCPVLVVRGE